MPPVEQSASEELCESILCSELGIESYQVFVYRFSIVVPYSIDGVLGMLHPIRVWCTNVCDEIVDRIDKGVIRRGQLMQFLLI